VLNGSDGTTLFPTATFKGGTVVLPVATTPDDVLDAIERERVTVGFGNPDLLDALTLSPRWTTTDLSSVRCIITGGAPVPERLIRTYGDRNLTFLQGYGLSEASPVVSVLDAASALRKSGSAGRPLMFVDVRTARRDGSDCASLETGELLVKGPNVMAGYWNRPDATRAAIDKRDWLHTGDAARIDEKGFLWIIDRVAHAYTSHGYVVYPGDVERRIGEHPAVRDVGVVGVDGSGRAFVVLRNGSEASASDIIEHCRARLDRRAVPATVAFVDALPRTSVGKLDRPALVEHALTSPEATAAGQMSAPDRVELLHTGSATEQDQRMVPQSGEPTLEMKRVVPAAPPVVFAAFSDADKLAKWWGPEGFTVPSLEFDPHVGAIYRIEMQPSHGDPFYLTGEFREVDPPVRLAFTFVYEDPDPDDVDTLVELSFRDRGESTEVVYTQGPFKTAARRALHRDGWTDSFNRLEQFIKNL
jgi:uncharacterized protein YndB with AHSA1/START domain